MSVTSPTSQLSDDQYAQIQDLLPANDGPQRPHLRSGDHCREGLGAMQLSVRLWASATTRMRNLEQLRWRLRLAFRSHEFRRCSITCII